MTDNKNEINEGTACRINGKVSVLKGNGDRLVISPGKMFNLGHLATHMNNRDNCKYFEKFFYKSRERIIRNI